MSERKGFLKLLILVVVISIIFSFLNFSFLNITINRILRITLMYIYLPIALIIISKLFTDIKTMKFNSFRKYYVIFVIFTLPFSLFNIVLFRPSLRHYDFSSNLSILRKEHSSILNYLILMSTVDCNLDHINLKRVKEKLNTPMKKGILFSIYILVITIGIIVLFIVFFEYVKDYPLFALIGLNIIEVYILQMFIFFYVYKNYKAKNYSFVYIACIALVFDPSFGYTGFDNAYAHLRIK